MPKIAYIEKKFSAGSTSIIDQANEIIAEYEAQGFNLTLRQLYYQFVARELLSNKQSEYKRLGAIINDARLAGLIDWDAIEDRTRHLEKVSSWQSPQEILDSCVSSYHIDLWKNQEFRVEVWIEKEALVGVIERVCREYDVPYFACRGYTSQSEQWRAGNRARQYHVWGQTPIILHFGDLDPSGIDMTRDNADRLNIFALESGVIEVKRLALNPDQVQQYNPPPNPAKSTDSRFASFVAKYGEESWELDALEPAVISNLIEDAVMKYIDFDKWDKRKALLEREKDQLRGLRDNWDLVVQDFDLGKETGGE